MKEKGKSVKNKKADWIKGIGPEAGHRICKVLERKSEFSEGEGTTNINKKKKKWQTNSPMTRSLSSRKPTACSTRMATVRFSLSLSLSNLFLFRSYFFMDRRFLFDCLRLRFCLSVVWFLFWSSTCCVLIIFAHCLLA